MNESLRNQFLTFSQTPYAAMSVSLSDTIPLIGSLSVTVPLIGSLSLSLFFALTLSLSLSFPLYQFFSLILSFFFNQSHFILLHIYHSIFFADILWTFQPWLTNLQGTVFSLNSSLFLPHFSSPISLNFQRTQTC